MAYVHTSIGDGPERRGRFKNCAYSSWAFAMRSSFKKEKKEKGWCRKKDWPMVNDTRWLLLLLIILVKLSIKPTKHQPINLSRCSIGLNKRCSNMYHRYLFNYIVKIMKSLVWNNLIIRARIIVLLMAKLGWGSSSISGSTFFATNTRLRVHDLFLSRLRFISRHYDRCACIHLIRRWITRRITILRYIWQVFHA